jgi:serine/threonine protein kinase
VQLQEQLHLTGQQITAFTPNYGAPEQFSRSYGATGPWTDVFAMALIVLELLRGGTKALEGDTYFELGVASCDPTKRPTPRELGLDVSPEVDAVFAKALALQPADRYPSMGAFWRDLFRYALPGTPTWQPSITNITSSNPEIDLTGRSSPSVSLVAGDGAAPDSPTVATMSGPITGEPLRSRTPLVVAGALAVAALVGASLLFLATGGRSDSAPAAAATSASEDATPTVTGEAPDEAETDAETAGESGTGTETDTAPATDASSEATASASTPAAPVPLPQTGVRPPRPPKPEPEPGKDAWDPSNFGGR